MRNWADLNRLERTHPVMKYEQQIKNLTFPDAKVTSFDLDLEKKVLHCSTDLSYIAGNENRMLGNTRLTIKNWKSMTIQKWEGDKFVNLDHHLKGWELKDICDNSFGKETSLKGFTVGTDFLDRI